MCFLSVCAPRRAAAGAGGIAPPRRCRLGGVVDRPVSAGGRLGEAGQKARRAMAKAARWTSTPSRFDALVRDVLLVAGHLHGGGHGAVGVHDGRGDRRHARHAFAVGVGEAAVADALEVVAELVVVERGTVGSDEVVALGQELVDLLGRQPGRDRLAGSEVEREPFPDRELVAQRAGAVDAGEHDPGPADPPEQRGGEAGLRRQVLQHRPGGRDQRAAGQVGVRPEDEPDPGPVAVGVAFDPAAALQHAEDPLRGGHRKPGPPGDLAQPQRVSAAVEDLEDVDGALQRPHARRGCVAGRLRHVLPSPRVAMITSHPPTAVVKQIAR